MADSRRSSAVILACLATVALWVGKVSTQADVQDPGEGVAVDADGNVYAAEGPISRPAAGSGLTKYLKR